MNKVILFCILSVLMLGNELFAQNPANESASFLNSLIKETDGVLYVKTCFIVYGKDGHDVGIASANGKWIIKHEIRSDSVRTSNQTDFTGKLLLYDRRVKNAETHKLFDLDGNLLFNETSHSEDERFKVRGRRFKAILKYLLNSDKDIQTDLLTDNDFGFARFESDMESYGVIKALEDGYVIFNTSGGAKLRGTFAINRDGKILTGVKSYCGNHTFYVIKEGEGIDFHFVRF